MSWSPALDVRWIRVMLADASPASRRRIRKILKRMGDVVLAGEATTAMGTVRAVRRKAPGVIVIQSTLARRGLLEAVRRLRMERPEVQVVAVTPDEPKVFLRTARGCGISYCVPLDFVDIRLPSLVRLAHRDHRESLAKRGAGGPRRRSGLFS